MHIELQHLSPDFLSAEQISQSGVYGSERSFERGKRYLVQAPSGSGKSTLLNILYGIQSRYSGEVKGIENSLNRFSYLLQDLRLFPDLSALDNVRIKNDLHHHKSEAEMKSMLERLGLGQHLMRPVSQLSYGQRQRVAIVRALCMPFEFLMLDEPFSHLDLANANVISTMIDEELVRNEAGLIIAMLDATEHFNYDYTYFL